MPNNFPCCCSHEKDSQDSLNLDNLTQRKHTLTGECRKNHVFFRWVTKDRLPYIIAILCLLLFAGVISIWILGRKIANRSHLNADTREIVCTGLDRCKCWRQILKCPSVQKESFENGYHSVVELFYVTCRDYRSMCIAEEAARYNFAGILCANGDMFKTLPLFGVLLTKDGHQDLLECFGDDLQSILHVKVVQWTYTWFVAGGIQNLNALSNMFDLLILSPPLMSLYASVAIVTQKRVKHGIIQGGCNALDTIIKSMEKYIHALNESQIREIVAHSISLFKRFPPNELISAIPSTTIPKDSPLRDSRVPNIKTVLDISDQRSRH
eukprot:230694_1